MTKELGKIKSAEFGHGGYDGAMIGITFGLGGNGWGTSDHWGFWNTERSDYCKWTEQDRKIYMGDVCMRVSQLLKEAKVTNVSQLVGIPIEVIFNGNSLSSWRILTEVL